MNTALVKKVFFEKFGIDPQVVVSSPGRINLIGEHIDYNGGYVLPAAIDKSILVAVSARTDDSCRLYSLDKAQDYTTSQLTEGIQKSKLGWPDFILGVADQLLQRGYSVKGFDMAITGNIPEGAGVSSSAAFECAVVFALNELFQFGLSKQEMVLIAQKAENLFVGVNCGVMDQFASMFGKKDHVIKLDCNTLEYEYVPFKTGNIKVVLLDTKVKHSLASSEYNTRRQECETGLSLLRKKYPALPTLTAATIDMLEECIGDAYPTVFSRCKYVVEEAARIANGCKDLEKNDLAAFGKKMYATHEGLSKLYAVSCRELDFIVEKCLEFPEVIGARMMGGGFGGCVIALIEEKTVETVSGSIARAYQNEFNKEMGMFEVAISDGTTLLEKH